MREEYSQFPLSAEILPIAAGQYKSTCEKLNKLYDLLAHHQAVAENIEQKYSTPAKARTKSTLYKIDFMLLLPPCFQLLS